MAVNMSSAGVSQLDPLIDNIQQNKRKADGDNLAVSMVENSNNLRRNKELRNDDIGDLLKTQQNLLSYAGFRMDRTLFQRSGTRYGGDFNELDIPNHLYFKIVFYFWNGDDEETGMNTLSGGLLAPSWMQQEELNADPYRFNSAYSYLINNNEMERANNLKRFITLLSDISSKSPWYFSELGNINTALSRKQVTDRDFKLEEQRQSITISCLEDAVDNRVGTLLDLYRSVVWSWKNKREVLPANLRKFDMGIYIYSAPIENLHSRPYLVAKIKNSSDTVTVYSNDIDEDIDFKNHNMAGIEKFRADKENKKKNRHMRIVKEYAEDPATIDINKPSSYLTSYKYIEFHNCEIDYNSPATGYEGVSNAEGFKNKYTINIFYDDCYEDRYNEFMLRKLGDLVLWDDDYNYSHADYMRGQNKSMDERRDELINRLNLPTINSDEYNSVYETLNPKTDSSKFGDFLRTATDGFSKNALSQVEGTAAGFLKHTVKKLIFGNLYGFSLTGIADTAGRAMSGDIMGTVGDVMKMKHNYDSKRRGGTKPEGNLFEEDDRKDQLISQSKNLGNLFKANTTINNL